MPPPPINPITIPFKSNDGVSERAVALKNIVNHKEIDENTEYIGEAIPGTLDNEAKWFIYKRFIDGAGTEKVRFANGSRKFNQIWEKTLNSADYAGYSFS
ncbi:MAG TPA: hypothetical protein VMW66_06230 [Elusimicrobiales bacterium]|nr:hypothetical protein [Elusimicrobiales bacterium]